MVSAIYNRLPPNLWSSCLSFPKTGITGGTPPSPAVPLSFPITWVRIYSPHPTLFLKIFLFSSRVCSHVLAQARCLCLGVCMCHTCVQVQGQLEVESALSALLYGDLIIRLWQMVLLADPLACPRRPSLGCPDPIYFPTVFPWLTFRAFPVFLLSSSHNWVDIFEPVCIFYCLPKLKRGHHREF